MTSPVRIGIAGITGRVGSLLVEELKKADPSRLTLVGGMARDGVLSPDLPPYFANFSDLAEICDLVIDFTHASVTMSHAADIVKNKVAWVLGTTGLSHTAQNAVIFASQSVPVVQSANFSPGVTLATRLTAEIAKILPADIYDAEIFEMHHRQKVDAPSGTALAFGEAIARARGVLLKDVKESGRDGHTGPRSKNAIGFASLRGGQIVGEHSVSFTSASEQLTLSHRAFDRRVFAIGAIRAALWLIDNKIDKGLYSMEDVLGLPPRS